MLTPSQAADMSTTCQLFWSTGDEGFPESQSLTCTLKLNNSRQCVQFPFPGLAQPLSALRLDVADSPASVVVLSMALRDAEQVAQWQWDGSPALFTDLADAGLTTGDAEGPVVMVTSYGLDPRCRLAIPAEVLARVEEGWHLELIISPQADPLHDLLRNSLQHDVRIGALSKLVVDQRQQLEEQRQQMARLEQALQEHTQRMERMAEESRVQQLTIARYEENDAIIRKKLAEQDHALKSITGNKWLRRLFSFKEAPSA